MDAATGFSETFTHLRTGTPCADRIGLMNVILAEGINLGLRKMADATNTHTFWELIRIARWHVEGEAYDRALAMVVEAQAALPMAQFWGTGTSASSDGQFFVATEQGEAMNLVNAKYGNTPGLKAYSHVSDQYAPFATQVIPATASEAPYILDGLLMNDAGRHIREQFADTGGFTDHVFAACAILGYRFAPRIRDLPSTRLYAFNPSAAPAHLRALIGGKINQSMIERNWPDILRIAATIAAGSIAPSLFPCNDEATVGFLGVADRLALAVPHRLVAVVGGGFLCPAATMRRIAGGRSSFRSFQIQERRPVPDVVLILGRHVPDDDCQLACRGDCSNVFVALVPGAHEEGAQAD